MGEEKLRFIDLRGLFFIFGFITLFIYAFLNDGEVFAVLAMAFWTLFALAMLFNEYDKGHMSKYELAYLILSYSGAVASAVLIWFIVFQMDSNFWENWVIVLTAWLVGRAIRWIFEYDGRR